MFAYEVAQAIDLDGAERRQVGPETVTETVTAQAALVSCGVDDRSAPQSVEQRSPKTAGPCGPVFVLRPRPPGAPNPSTSGTGKHDGKQLSYSVSAYGVQGVAGSNPAVPTE